jgi:hypothetical protein
VLGALNAITYEVITSRTHEIRGGMCYQPNA